MSQIGKINSTTVHAFIFAPKNARRVIWSPATTLEAMGFERYPHYPAVQYRKMKKVLEQLCRDGFLVLRPRPHSHYSMKETAYERA